MNTLTFTPLEETHLDVLFENICGNVAEYFYTFASKDALRVWIREAIEKHVTGTKKEYVVFEAGVFIGMISPAYISAHEVEIGMWVAPSKQGNGYGAQMLTTLLDMLTQEGVTRVLYETELNNVPSIRLAESLEFTRINDGDNVQFVKEL